MNRTPRLAGVVILACTAVLGFAHAAAGQGPLRIVVVEGEDAVNIIQQKTAVAPVIEVRDKNGLPVPGAIVTFAVEGGKSAVFSGGLSTLTVTTNAAGQAAAAGFSPVLSGAVQINVQAAFQGQVVAATIAQTNVLTAAEAAAAAGAGGAGGASGASGATGAGGAAGGGGGISATTIGIVGGAIAGGAVAATQLTGSNDASAAGDQGIYQGAFTIEMTWTFGNGGSSTCTRLERYTGTLEMELELKNGAITGNAYAKVNDGSSLIVNGNCPNGPQTGQRGTWGMPTATATGSPSGMTFTQQLTGQAQDCPTCALTTVTTNWKFTGAVRGDAIVGDYSMAIRQEPVGFPPNSTSGVSAITLSHIR